MDRSFSRRVSRPRTRGAPRVARRIRGPIPLAVPVGILSFIGFLELSSRLRLEIWAALIVSAAMAVQSGRFVRPRGDGFLRLVRWTAGLLVAILLATMFWTVGGRIWSEHRQKSALPTAPSEAKNLLVIVWDTARRRQHELIRISPRDHTKARAFGEPRSTVRPGILGVAVDTSFARKHVHRSVAS